MKATFFFLLLLCAKTAFAQSNAAEQITEHAAERAEDMEAWEDYYRTSDDPARKTARPTRKGPKGEKALPENMARVGCICMDNVTRRQTGTGACGGHRGVRFWVYENENRDTLMLATERHKLHPEPLSAEQPITFGNATQAVVTPETDKPPYGKWLAQWLGVAIGIFMVWLAFRVIRKYRNYL